MLSPGFYLTSLFFHGYHGLGQVSCRISLRKPIGIAGATGCAILSQSVFCYRQDAAKQQIDGIKFTQAENQVFRPAGATVAQI